MKAFAVISSWEFVATLFDNGYDMPFIAMLAAMKNGEARLSPRKALGDVARMQELQTIW